MSSRIRRTIIICVVTLGALWLSLGALRPSQAKPLPIEPAVSAVSAAQAAALFIGPSRAAAYDGFPNLTPSFGLVIPYFARSD